VKGKAFPPEVRERFVELVCAGASLRAAADAVGVSPALSVVWWSQCGRMELRCRIGQVGGLGQPVPDDPGRGTIRRSLTSEDRAVIAAGLQEKLKLCRIAELVGRNRSVVSREVERNRSPDGVYRGVVAHRAAAVRRSRPKPFKLVGNRALCGLIEDWMDQGWSPGLIAQMLRVEHGANMMERVSHETIYRALYVQTRGQLRADLHQRLSLKRKQRKPRGGRGPGSSGGPGGMYAEAFTISQRPAEVADRAVPGHWEGDLIIGAGSGSAIGTLVERTSRFVMLLHLPGRHDANSVAEAMIREMGQLPEHLRRSITWDRGVELARYAEIQVALDAKVFFCDPHSPWQRGTNENTNRLLRFWFEKGTDLSVHTAEDLRRIAAILNNRPRPTLDLQTPAERLNQLLNQTAA
jgi:IS30 family transposase